MAFEDRILLEIGTWPVDIDTDAEKNQIITDALEDVITELPLSSLFSIAEIVTDSGSGYAKSGRRILRVFKGDYIAEKVDYLYANDSTRTFIETNPVWYEIGGTAYVLPSGGSLMVSKALTADKDTTTITGANTLFDRLVIYKAALNALRYKMRDAREAVDAEITLPTAPTAPAAPSFAYVDATAATVSATTIGAFGTVPVYTQPTLSEDYTDFTTYFDLEDSEVTTMALNKISSQVEVFRADMEDALNVFNDANVEYQASIQDAIQQAQITLAEARQNAQMSTDVSVQNEARTLEASVSEYVQTLQRFAQEINLYQAEVASTVRKWEVSLQRGTNEARMLNFESQRIQLKYVEALNQYLKSYNEMPRVRVWHHEF